MLEGNPRLKGARLVFQSEYVAPFYERPIEFPHSIIVIETYLTVSIQLRTVFTRYIGLRRSRELCRKFNPARLV